MNKEIAQYINELLADREHLLELRQDDSDNEKDLDLKEATKSELALIYKAQKSMDYIIEEEEGMECHKLI